MATLRLNVYRHDLLERTFIEFNRWTEVDEQYGLVEVAKCREVYDDDRISDTSRYFYMSGIAVAPMTFICKIDIEV